MSEEHEIVGLARGEPLPAGRVGVCLRFPLSGSPSPRWSRDLSARLVRELTGRPAVGHLRLNEIVHGQEIVLEGVESDEASHIAEAVERAVRAANSDCADAEDFDQSANVSQSEADSIARDVRARQGRPDP
jgi:hypothetical protein